MSLPQVSGVSSLKQEEEVGRKFQGIHGPGRRQPVRVMGGEGIEEVRKQAGKTFSSLASSQHTQ